MALHLAVANRKGGVGKSTVSVMLAHSLSVWGGMRVLVIDVDSQCNSSLILLGGEGWRDARDSRRSIAHYLTDFFKEEYAAPEQYIVSGVGDVIDAGGGQPALDLLPGSLLLDDVQGDLFLDVVGEGRVNDAMAGLRERIEVLLRRCAANYDVALFDCAPGLSFATHAAISTADKVIVPFRPDYVSLMAIDRISLVIEGVSNLDQLAAVPIARRRYACLPNYIRSTGAERLLVEEVGLMHPLLTSQIAQSNGMADAFEWSPRKLPLEAKYSDASADIRRLYQEISDDMFPRAKKPEVVRPRHEQFQPTLGA